nr:immunoglobulin heavy chain junction region [Mus musculus]
CVREGWAPGYFDYW